MKRIIISIVAVVMCITSFAFVTAEARDFSREETYALQLKELGLFQGVSETDFDLERAPTRVEAIVMLIRVLGKESEVNDGVWRHPFTDVPKWADKYVGYAYCNGLSNGVDTTLFGTGSASSQMYLTFVLRALGYSDEGGEDFVWNNPYALAQKIGVLPNSVDTNNFLRADVVLVSHAALNANLKDTHTPLSQKLMDAGVFTKKQFVMNYTVVEDTEQTPGSKKELNSEQIYKMCSPAVFTILTYDKNDEGIAQGSGFFIDDKGIAITNYHVIEDAYSAQAYIEEEDKYYDIKGVYGWDADNDWAVVQVDVKGKDFLEVGDKSTVVGGSAIYALGSPIGLTDTITQGIISNPSRQIGDYDYIQISAAVTNGNSGGALINKYGEVIGINTWVYGDGSLGLNFAVPVYDALGFSKEKLYPFADVVKTMKGANKKDETESGGTVAENAFDELYDFIVENGEAESDGSYSYEDYLENEGNVSYFTFTAEENGEIYTIIQFLSDDAFVQYAFTISRNSTDVTAYLEFYTLEDSGTIPDEPDIEGSLSFDARSFDGIKSLEFTSLSDSNTEIRAILGELATKLQTLGLAYIDYIFILGVGSDYTHEDLGYVNYDLDDEEEDYGDDYREDNDDRYTQASEHDMLVEYIIKNGEYSAEYDEYSITYTTEMQYIFLEYDVANDRINAGAMMLEDSSMGQLEFSGVDSSYETWYAIILEGDTMMMSGTVLSGKSNLKDNCDKYISVDWLSTDDEILEADEIESSLLSSIKKLLSTSTINIVLNIDNYILDGTGLSISEIYGLPTE